MCFNLRGRSRLGRGELVSNRGLERCGRPGGQRAGPAAGQEAEASLGRLGPGSLCRAEDRRGDAPGRPSQEGLSRAQWFCLCVWEKTPGRPGRRLRKPRALRFQQAGACGARAEAGRGARGRAAGTTRLGSTCAHKQRAGRPLAAPRLRRPSAARGGARCPALLPPTLPRGRSSAGNHRRLRASRARRPEADLCSPLTTTTARDPRVGPTGTRAVSQDRAPSPSLCARWGGDRLGA